MGRKKQKAPEGGGGAGWLVTYGDLMTLLLCFFVLLYGMSKLDEGKFKEMSQSLNQALVGNAGKTIFDKPATPSEEQLVDDVVEQEVTTPELNEDIVEEEIPEEEVWLPEVAGTVKDVLSDYLEENGLSSDVTVELIDEGVLLDIKETVLFSLGDASIKPQSLGTLNELGVLFGKIANEVRVIGHTDNIPINTAKYPSNWELAAARSCAIVRYYTMNGFKPERFLCTSQGESNPVATNDTEEGRAQNRRVNFIIVATPAEILELTDLLKREMK